MYPGISFVDSLRQDLASIEAHMMELLDRAQVERFVNSPDSPVVVLGFPEYYWATPTPEEQRRQMELRQLFSAWYERFELLFEHAAPETRKQIDETHKFVTNWIEKNRSYDIQPSAARNKATFTGRVQGFYRLLDMVAHAPSSEVILVPDTNALVFVPDLAGYATIAGTDTYTVVLVPTVLGELDKLKIVHRDAGFRDKVNGVIRRIKGLRNQGSMRTGVTLNKTVTVKMVAQEPNFNKTLHWLDHENADDRIIASVLELQRDNPSAHVVLVTGDINLQNKGEMAGIPFSEPPENRA